MTAPASRRWVCAAVCLSLCWAVPPSPQTQGHAPSPAYWDVKLIAGHMSIPPGTKLRVVVGDDFVVLNPRRGPGISIPVAGIVDVISNSRVRYPAWDAQMKAWRVWSEATGGYGLVFFPFGLPFLMASTGAKKREYIFSIVWRSGEMEENIVFAVVEEDYTPLLEAVNRAAGKNWKNAQLEWQKVEQALKQQPENTFFIQLDRGVELGGATVKPGKYTVVFLPRADSLGELYFFQGHGVDTAKLVIASPAMIFSAMGPGEPYSPAHPDVRISTPAREEPAVPGSEPAQTQVTYKSANGVTTIAEIRTPKKTLKLP